MAPDRPKARRLGLADLATIFIDVPADRVGEGFGSLRRSPESLGIIQLALALPQPSLRRLMVPEGPVFPDGLASVLSRYLAKVRGFAVLAFSRDNGAHRYNMPLLL
jgi:hypothetical protein